MSSFVEYVENKLQLAVAAGDKFTCAALRSFLSAMPKEMENGKWKMENEPDGNSEFSILNSQFRNGLREWVATMRIAGLSRATIKRYYGKLRALRNEWVTMPDGDPFDEVAPMLDDTREVSKLPAQNLERLLGIWRFACPQANVGRFACPQANVGRFACPQANAENCSHEDMRTSIPVFLFLLYNPDISLAEIPELTFDSPIRDLPQNDDIVDELRQSRRTSRLFGLGQGRKRAPQIRRELVGGLSRVAKALGIRTALREVDMATCRHKMSARGLADRLGGGHDSMPTGEMSARGLADRLKAGRDTSAYGKADLHAEFSRETITALWIAAALRQAVPLSEIRALIGKVPEEYWPLGDVTPAEISEERKTAILRKVADSICDNTTQWFAMRLRAGNTVDDIKQAIERLDIPEKEGIEYYYPTRLTISADRRRKRKKEEVAFLPGVLFFRTRRDNVAPLFAKIGDRAWCYRVSSRPGAPYSAISRREMADFQRHIGRFTADIEAELIETGDEYKPGDEVRITAGMMEGQVGRIAAVSRRDGRVTYELRLSEATAFRWTVTVGASQLTPAELKMESRKQD